ncbi:MAG: cell division ATP-binding protein FtsE [Candidatus Nealsonbacteria bacterium]
MISFQNVTKIYHAGPNPITALNNVSFDIKTGEFVSVVGRSGAGKTTLFKLLLVKEKSTEGEIFFEENNVFQMKPEELPHLRRKIGVVFQDYKLLPSKTTYENIAYIMEVMGASKEQISRDVPEVLELVGLTERADNFPEELSGGERQRATIARALIHRPKIILADEPTGNLDPYQTQDVIRLLIKVHEMGTTVVLATHNKDIINSLQKRVITLEEGKLIRDEAKGRFVL